MKAKKKPFKYKRAGCRPTAVKTTLRGARAGDKVKTVLYTAIGVRPEHYYMLRELAEYYEAPMTRTLAALIVKEYCRLLSKTEPAKAAQIRDTYKNDKIHAKYVVDLNS